MIIALLLIAGRWGIGSLLPSILLNYARDLGNWRIISAASYSLLRIGRGGGILIRRISLLFQRKIFL